MSISSHYLSKSNNVSISTYRHTLFVGIHGHLTGTNIKQTTKAYLNACSNLDQQYEYWGQILYVNREITADDEITEYMMSEVIIRAGKKRKCCCVVILPNSGDIERIYSTIVRLLPDVPTETFKTLPEAIEWTDRYMNDFASRELAR